jgi:transposase
MEFQQIIPIGCAADVHKEIIAATIRRSDSDFETREFESYTSSLIELRDIRVDGRP